LRLTLLKFRALMVKYDVPHGAGVCVLAGANLRSKFPLLTQCLGIDDVKPDRKSNQYEVD